MPFFRLRETPLSSQGARSRRPQLPRAVPLGSGLVGELLDVPPHLRAFRPGDVVLHLSGHVQRRVGDHVGPYPKLPLGP